jgi:hypothetical protein
LQPEPPENLINQLFRKFHVVVMEPEVHHCHHRILSFCPLLNHFHNILTTYFSFNLILSILVSTPCFYISLRYSILLRTFQMSFLRERDEVSCPYQITGPDNKKYCRNSRIYQNNIPS